MATKKRVTSWVVTDNFWARVEPLVPVRERPVDKEYARKAIAQALPKRSFGSAFHWQPVRNTYTTSSNTSRAGFGLRPPIHKRFLEWKRAGVFEAIWAAGLAEYDQMEGIAWQWQSIDGAIFKAPLAQEHVGPDPTDRGKKWEQASPAGRRPWRPLVVRRNRSEPA